MSGRLAPGMRLIESEVADRLGVSRSSVRAALQRLKQEGYVVASGGHKQERLAVAPLTLDDARELFGIVAEVEGLAARWATCTPAATRHELAAELRRLDTRLRWAARQEPADSNEIFEIFTRFHREYVELGAGPRLLALHDAIKPQADRYRRLYSTALINRIDISLAEHEDIVRALESGDPDAAQAAVQANWRNAAERLCEVMEKLGEQGSW